VLLVSCERGQKVIVGSAGITVTVMEVRGDRVRLAVSAPAGCAVHREEVGQQLRQPGPPQGGETSPAA
jgi:carbon storage regulator CsrA